MSKRSDEALNALAHAVVEHKGLLEEIREQAHGILFKRALDKIIEAADEVEAAWAENERTG